MPPSIYVSPGFSEFVSELYAQDTLQKGADLVTEALLTHDISRFMFVYSRKLRGEKFVKEAYRFSTYIEPVKDIYYSGKGLTLDPTVPKVVINSQTILWAETDEEAEMDDGPLNDDQKDFVEHMVNLGFEAGTSFSLPTLNAAASGAGVMAPEGMGHSEWAKHWNICGGSVTSILKEFQNFLIMKFQLTPPQQQLSSRGCAIAEAIVRGMTNKEINNYFDMSSQPTFPKRALDHMFEKTGTSNRTELSVKLALTNQISFNKDDFDK